MDLNPAICCTISLHISCKRKKFSRRSSPEAEKPILIASNSLRLLNVIPERYSNSRYSYSYLAQLRVLVQLLLPGKRVTKCGCGLRHASLSDSPSFCVRFHLKAPPSFRNNGVESIKPCRYPCRILFSHRKDRNRWRMTSKEIIMSWAHDPTSSNSPHQCCPFWDTIRGSAFCVPGPSAPVSFWSSNEEQPKNNNEERRKKKLLGVHNIIEYRVLNKRWLQYRVLLLVHWTLDTTRHVDCRQSPHNL